MPVPQRLGRYAVRRRIGTGGFATVWLAYDEQLDSPVAIKVLADNWAADDQVRRRFLEEGRYLRRVESPHVVAVYDAGELDDGRPYLVMAYADQGTLADRLEVEGLTAGQAMEVVRQVGAGLQALHDRDILHRDVKPANVLFRTVGDDVRAMVGDLGLGKALDVSSRLTMIAGTPSFVAPEQAQAESPDARADQYSLAALAFLLLGGRPAYAHTSLHAAADPAAPPALSTPERPLGEAADEVVRRALARDPDDRFPSVTAFVAALDEALDLPAEATPQPWLPVDPQLTQPGNRPSARPADGDLDPPVPPRRRRALRWSLAAASAVVALGAGAAAGWWWVERQHEPVRVADATGSLAVTVPEAWAGAVARDSWTPPGEQLAYAALSVGTDAAWPDDGDEEGVFVGVLPGSDLPELLPGHPECEAAAEPITEAGEQPSVTVLHTGCDDGILVERVVQVAGNRLLWVQVRSDDRATANRVLDSVRTSGF